MPLYRTTLGVLVDLPAEKAERNGGMIPVDSAPPSPRKAAKKVAPSKSKILNDGKD